VPDSENFNAGSYYHNSSMAITSNAAISPDGTQNADSLVNLGSGNRMGKNIAMTSGNKYALSIYYKNNGGNNQIPFAGSNTTGATTVTITDEWARYTIILTATATMTSNLRFMSGMANANLFAWGAQIEELSYATSYIPTFGSTVTRNKDIVDNEIDIFIMGDDWEGEFDFLEEYCEVLYLPRTIGISTTKLKTIINKN